MPMAKIPCNKKTKESPFAHLFDGTSYKTDIKWCIFNTYKGKKRGCGFFFAKEQVSFSNYFYDRNKVSVDV